MSETLYYISYTIAILAIVIATVWFLMRTPGKKDKTKIELDWKKEVGLALFSLLFGYVASWIIEMRNPEYNFWYVFGISIVVLEIVGNYLVIRHDKKKK